MEPNITYVPDVASRELKQKYHQQKFSFFENYQKLII